MGLDLNPNENLWKELKKRVRKRNPSNLVELEAVALEEWKKIPSSVGQNLVKSYRNRLFAVIKAKGLATKH